jgi:hypothetical protein
VKPHPRIRKLIKWGGAAVTLLLVVAWVGSGWYWVTYVGRGGWYVGGGGANPGTVGILIGDDPKTFRLGWYGGGDVQVDGWDWWFTCGTDSRGFNFDAPLWLPVVLVLAPTLLAWRLDAKARRVARAGLCRKCGYDVTTLPPALPCPECGYVSGPSA